MQGASRRRGAGRRHSQRNAAPGLAFYSTAGFVGSCVLLGGVPVDASIPILLILLAGAWLAGVNGWLGRWRLVADLPLGSAILFALVVAVPVLQLIPLPAQLWQELPGRALATEVMRTIGQGDAWRPLSLSVVDTTQSVAMMLAMAALFVAVLGMNDADVRRLMIVVVALTGVELALGVLEVASRGEFFIYARQTRGVLTGTFLNKNHAGLFLALALLCCAAAFPRDLIGTRRGLTFAVPIMLVFVVAAVLTFSRAGVVLLALALVMAVTMTFGPQIRRYWRLTLAALAGAVAALASLASTDLAGKALDRFRDVSDDDRWMFWTRSWSLVGDTFPIGTGLGAFPIFYTTVEQLAWVRRTQLNHVHNDYLELVIETGVIGVIVPVLALWVFVGALRRIWPERHGIPGRYALIGAAMVLLCTLHSGFDYPLRRPAIAAIFILAWALLQRPLLRRMTVAGSPEVCEGSAAVAGTGTPVSRLTSRPRNPVLSR